MPGKMCQFEFETWTGPDCFVNQNDFHTPGTDNWECPHESVDTLNGEARCIFHLPNDQKDDTAVEAAFFESIAEAAESDDPEIQKHKQQFIGAQFGSLGELTKEQIISGAEDTPINLKHAEFDGDITNIDRVESDLLMNGATFKQGIDLEGTDFEGIADFRRTIFKGQVSFRNATFESLADFRVATFNNLTLFENVDFRGLPWFRFAIFKGIIQFNESIFDKSAKFSDTKFEDEAYFRGSTFRDEAIFQKGVFEKHVDFRNVVFQGKADFKHTEFGDVAYFPEATFATHADFRETSIQELGNFRDTTVRFFIGFKGASFDGEARFMNASLKRADFRNVVFNGTANFTNAGFTEAKFNSTMFNSGTSFRREISERMYPRSLFQGETQFANITARARIDFRTTEDGRTQSTSEWTPIFSDTVIFSDANLSGGFDIRGATFGQPPRFNHSDLTDSALTNADLRGAMMERVQLSRATIFNTDFRGAYLAGSVFGDVRVNEGTKFLAYGDEANSWLFNPRQIRSIPCCVYDPKYSTENISCESIKKAQTFYQTIEEVASKSSRPDLKAHCLIRRNELQHKKYKQEFITGDTIKDRLIAGGFLGVSGLNRSIILYGESPWRVVGTGLLIILLSALIYPFGGFKTGAGTTIHATSVTEFLATLPESIYFSTLTFTTVSFEHAPSAWWGRLLATIEAGLGGLLLALLVFVLGRRAAR